MRKSRIARTCAIFCMLVLISIPQPSTVAQTSQPHIILILTDDMRFDFFSASGHPYLETPNIDRLANEGTIFSRAYVATPLCGPNRASINTGLLSSQHGIINHTVHKDPKSRYPGGNFLPTSLHSTVGQTAMIGKWFHSPNAAHRPEYDRWFVHNGVDGPFSLAYFERFFNVNGVQRRSDQAAAIAGSPTQYATDIEFYESARWITEHSRIQTFQFLSPYAPHTPDTPAERHNGIYDGMTIPLRPNFSVNNPVHMAQLTKNYNNRCEMMLAVDEGIGHLLNRLEDEGILEDSVIVFTSDNGMMFGEHGRRFEKKVPFEEACRIPLLVRYGKNVAGQGPVDPDQLVSQTDLMLTFIELAGGKVPQAAQGTNYYGRSLAPEWMGSAGYADVQRRSDVVMIYYHNDSTDNMDELDNDGLVWASIVTDDGFRYTDINLDIGDDVNGSNYHQFIDGLSPRLINLNKDPYETKNLIGHCGYIGKRKELQDRLAHVLTENSAEFEFTPPATLLGDVNQDRNVDFLDINAFVGVILNERYQIEADINEDCSVDLVDITPFVELLSQ